jgi:uncharacterized protein
VERSRETNAGRLDPLSRTSGEGWDREGFEILGEEECFRLLSVGTIGRIAVTMGAIPAIFPVNYLFADGAICFRTGAGTKLSAATRHAVVAFEVDEIDRLYHSGWSVLAVGMASVVDEDADLARIDHLPLRAWAPGERAHVIRIVPEFVSGRQIVPGHGESTALGSSSTW